MPKKTKKTSKKITKKSTKKAAKKATFFAAKKTVKIAVKRKMVRKKKSAPIFTMGNIGRAKSGILLAILGIIFVETLVLIPRILPHKEVQAQVKGASVVRQMPQRNVQLEKEIREMVKGYPIEEMVPYIASKDKQVAAFLVAIAKKESAWGKHKPVLAGEDCYNYWGFRLKGDRMGSGGHTCFDSPKQAVDAVSDRIEELVKDYNKDTASKMIVWKCGYNCEGQDPESVNKWINDVDYYYRQVLN